ncbi:uncharacterized protein LOC124491105 [Dermatophagoides farinae]|uniref:uncharacterized protein LOC124491105 n=1 Tax=Dermatophagoides farinae TaxID=6954 RepID=UPI003F63C27B
MFVLIKHNHSCLLLLKILLVSEVMNPANLKLLRRQISCLFNRFELNQLILDHETIDKIEKLAEKLAIEHENYFNDEFDEEDLEVNIKISEYTLKMKKLLEFISSAKDESKVKIPKLKLQFSGFKKDWLSFLSLFQEMSQLNNFNIKEKFLLLLSALPERLKNGISLEPNELNFNWLIDFLNNKFGSEEIKESEILSQVEKLNVKSGPTWLIIEKIDKLFIQALNADISFDVREYVFRKKIWSAIPLATANEIKREEDQSVQNILKLLREKVRIEREWKLFQDSRINFSKDSFNSSVKCEICNLKNHQTFKCRNGSVESRKEAVFKKKLCLRCLKPGHNVKDCKSKFKCSFCKGDHASVICKKEKDKKGNVNNLEQASIDTCDSEILNC